MATAPKFWALKGQIIPRVTFSVAPVKEAKGKYIHHLI